MAERVISEIFAADADILEDEVLYGRIYDSLSRQRKEKIDKLRLGSEKRRSAAAGALLSYALEKYGRSSDFHISLSDNGKPYIAEYPDFNFNISHSCSWAICAVSNSEIGCDIEKIKDKVPYRIAERFTSDERELIRSQNDEYSARNAFFRIWTLRESYVKATGDGLTLPFDSYGITFVNDVPEPADKNSPYSFYEYSDFDGYKCSVCVKDGRTGIPPELSVIDIKLL